MSDSKKAASAQPTRTITEFLRDELADTASLYFAPVTSAARTIRSIWIASGSGKLLSWQAPKTEGGTDRSAQNPLKDPESNLVA
jgi:hypothetical protein